MARNMRNVDLNLLPVFSALMRDKNLSHTADNLGMTQPAVSQALKRLRSLYNDPLFERKGGKMEPTLKAESIAHSIEGILNNVVETLPEQGKFDPCTSKKHFHINMTGVPHRLFMTEIAKRIAQLSPTIALTVSDEQIDDIEKSLRDREFDIHIDYIKIEQAGIHQQVFFDDKLCIIARKDHPRLGALTEITLDQYIAECHAVLLPRANNIYPLKQAVPNRDFKREIRYTDSSIQNIIETVGVTDYICTMPLGTLSSMFNVADYVWFEPPFETNIMDIYMNWHWAMEHHQSHRWLRSLILNTCKNLGVNKA
jgi:LysR family transcriptional activator for leuABCD operon